MEKVSIRRCEDYDPSRCREALLSVLAPLGGLDWVKPGMKIAIKANLVSALRPEAAATTHPVLLAALVRLLCERGAEVRIGDSPGGVFNSIYVERVYSVCGLDAVVEAGGALNRDFGTAEGSCPEAKLLKQYQYTGWLDWADEIISFSKLKVHAMMRMTAATKNLFGCIPGSVKAEYHYRFPDYADFADMLVDLNLIFKPRLHICDAVVGMEGNGPTQGTPRRIGAVLASASPYALDLAAAKLIGLSRSEIPYLEAAFLRGLIPAEPEEPDIDGALSDFLLPDFKQVAGLTGLTVFSSGGSFFSRLFNRFSSAVLQSRPKLQREKCVGCGVCARSCPASAIELRNGRPEIDRRQCIRCFCCQELCPKGAMISARPPLARLLGRI